LFENIVPRKIFGPKRDRVTEGWRKVYNEEHHNLYSSPSTVIAGIKSRRLGRAGHVAYMAQKRDAFRILVGKPGGRRPLEGLDIGGRIILKRILVRCVRLVWTEMIWLGEAGIYTVLSFRVS
jgi:hypothetical protein